MTKEIRAYLAFITAIFTNPDFNDWAQLEKEILIRIGFYQHERLIHFLVTMLFVALTATSLIVTFSFPQFLWLTLLFLVLLIPYIWHYFFLENSVQKLYRYYYQIHENARGCKSKGLSASG